MLLLLMTIAQPVAAISAIEPRQLTEKRCKAGADRETGEIVVCAKPPQDYRLGPEAPLGPALPPASVKLSGNVAAKIHVEQQDVGGFPSNRVMLSVKLRF